MNASSKLLGRLMWAMLVASAVGCMGPEEEEAAEAAAAGQEAEEVGQVEARMWMGWTSEEYQPLKCASGRLVSGVGCSGGYCDNVNIHCALASGIFGTSSWGPYFSEESPNRYTCPPNTWMTGIACRGSNCDSISIECTEVDRRTVGTCAWTTQTYSEEQGYFLSQVLNQYIRGIECSGPFCDNKRYYLCMMQ